MGLSEAFPVCLAPREKDRMVEPSAGGGSLFHKEGHGCKGSQLSHGGPDTGSKEVQLIRGSKRTERSGRDGTKNETRKILWC